MTASVNSIAPPSPRRHTPPARGVYHARDTYFGESPLDRFSELIQDSSGERKLDAFLKAHENRPVLATCLAMLSTGQHGAWVIPQQEVRPTRSGVEPGLIPDYILGAKNSDGFSWYLLDLKGANAKLFSRVQNRTYFSSVDNKGVFQMLEYIEHCAGIQSYLRETLGLTGFGAPRGFLIIGRAAELEEDAVKSRLRRYWNELSGNRLQVRTYDALLQGVQTQVAHNERDRAENS